MAPAQPVADRRGETGFREEIGQIEEDRDLFGDQLAAMPDRRYLAQRVDRQIFRLALFARLHVQDLEFERRAQLLKEGEGAR